MIIQTWTGAHVRALSAALRWTQEHFADRTGIPIATVKKWHRLRAKITLRASSAADMDTLLKTLDEEQLERFRTALAKYFMAAEGPIIASTGDAETREIPVEVWEDEDDVNRRQLATTVGGVSLAAAGYPIFRRLPNTQVGASDVADLMAVVDRFVHQDQQIGGNTLVEAAQRQLAQAKWMLETCEFSDDVAARFTSAVGNMAVRAGWLAYDADHQNVARQSYSEAIALATIAHDDELTIHACVNSAMQAIHLSRRLSTDGRPLGSARHALRLLSRARDLTHGVPPGRIHSLIGMREAIAYAALGDESGFRRAIAGAEREMDQAAEYEPITQCPTWLRFMSHTEVTFHEAIGLTYLALSDPHRSDHTKLSAAVNLSALVTQQQDSPRNAVASRAGYASNLALVGDTAGALEQANLVLTQLEGPISSTRVLRSLHPVRMLPDKTSNFDDFSCRFDDLIRRAGVAS